jgi:hypothetical protein
MTALELGPVSQHWIDAGFRGQQAPPWNGCASTGILTQGPDPLHLAVVFDLDAKTAIHYAWRPRSSAPLRVEAKPRDVFPEPTASNVPG